MNVAGSLRAVAIGLVAVGAATNLGLLGRRLITPPDLVLLYLLAVMLVATLATRTASIITAMMAVAAYDYFFVPPLMAFSVADTRQAFTFAMLLGVGAVVSTLTARVRRSERDALDRERRTASLYALSRELAQTLEPVEMARILARRASEAFRTNAGVVLDPEHAAMALHTTAATLTLGPAERVAVRRVLEHGGHAGRGTNTVPEARLAAVAIEVPERRMGALVLEGALDDHTRSLVDAFVQPGAIALERARLSAAVQAAQLTAQAQSLRATLLSTVSHDLRTPLAAITGAASTLKNADLPVHVHAALLDSIEDESARLERLISNLLEMTRLQAGAVEPKKELVPLDEVVGAALARLERPLTNRAVKTALAETLPLLSVDPLLFEQLFVNLFENANKYSPAGAPIEVVAALDGAHVSISVMDRGPGVPEHLRASVFEPFVRGAAGRGTGLGLAIARGIATIHGGTLECDNRSDGGACFTLRLPHG